MRGPDLKRLYDEHAQPLYAFLLNLTRNESDTHDVLQEIFVKLARNERLLTDVRDERAFLIRLAHNAAIDLIRRRGTRERTKENLVGENVHIFAPTDQSDEKLFHDALAAALAELPEEQRAVVHLKLWEGLTLEEIADTLDIPPNTAASRYRYGIDKLRAHLRPFYEELKKAEQ